MKNRPFGRWTVISDEKVMKNGKKHVLCRCECGTIREVRWEKLVSGKSQSCGCLQREQMAERKKRHGETNSRLHVIWRGMKQRCANSHAPEYDRYGGRGITVCKEWFDSFESFRDWAIANGYRAYLTLDRKDNNGPYSPENCHWATRREQNSNKGNNRRITIGEETHTVTEWGEIMGISRQTIFTRLNRGWSEEAAIMTPKKPKGDKVK